ncbi:MAG: winged helix-turn-helix domain-containing protein, partial [Algicola sp.]|nr:winged helix-turn-helix domain-containing protein [Algicola sp.]
METNGSYYLIDNEVRYYPASQLVEHPQQSVQLTDFQHKLLIYFLDNPKVVRSYEQISQHVWPNKITTVDAFNKPLGAIRNALSDNIKSKKNHYIKTWAREGYGLGCSCIFIENEQKMKSPISWMIPAFLASIALIVIAFAYVVSVRNPVFEVDNLRKLTSLLETVA